MAETIRINGITAFFASTLVSEIIIIPPLDDANSHIFKQIFSI